ncbi:MULTISPECIES: hypothetical protein [Mycobacteroides]|uniref:hypothetical protein n=1 Tax=Mycobacteroides TaxID=670516 RepID=UPI0009271390|nr:hypothetical protein [Mycobacteroides abscessus]NGX06440.1 hypothetical protein [Mycobacteroides franklinii]SHT25770.1 Uncharacterised protein [Mycobacteroides abscessus subsp. abscessus]SHZ43712.1 Uncharacterised protein [Mycobacteroides abscessus subsp. abscessus]
MTEIDIFWEPHKLDEIADKLLRLEYESMEYADNEDMQATIAQKFRDLLQPIDFNRVPYMVSLRHLHDSLAGGDDLRPIPAGAIRIFSRAMFDLGRLMEGFLVENNRRITRYQADLPLEF